MQRSHPAPHHNVDPHADQAVSATNEKATSGMTSAGATGLQPQQGGAAPKARDPASGTVDESVEQQTSIGSAGADRGELLLLRVLSTLVKRHNFWVWSSVWRSGIFGVYLSALPCLHLMTEC